MAVKKKVEPKTDLFLILKGDWYDLIEAKIKTEEYRAITPYWVRRLLTFEEYPKEHPKACKYFPEDICFDVFENGHDFTEVINGYWADFKKFKTVTFQHGYSKTSRRMTFELLGYEVRTGKIEWGAAPGVKYFVIKLGKRLK